MAKVINSIVNAVVPNNEPKMEIAPQHINEIYQNVSPLLVCSITPCDKDGNLLGLDTVKGLFVDGSKSFESQWQTPFESYNPEHKLPTLMATLQSGGLVDSVSRIMGTPEDGSVRGELTQQMEQLIGKTSLTKVNTQQIFLSTQSVRANLTLFFIAMHNALTEVEHQIGLLEQWTLPQHLYDRSVVESFLTEPSLASIFPSDIPSFVAITIHGKTYKPFIIDNVSEPIKAPIDKNGNRLSLTVELSIMSRMAWDSRDVANFYGMTMHKVG